MKKKILYAVLILVLVSFTIPTVFADPIVTGNGYTVKTAILQTPEFEVDIFEFDTTKEIILNIKFENTGNKFHGINWVIEQAVDGINPDPDEFYKKHENYRKFYITVDDLTNSVKYEIDEDDLFITTNDDFLLLHGETKNYKDAFVVEILDIDELVNSTPSGNKKIQTQLNISSSKFFPDHTYEISVWTSTRLGVDPIIITLPPAVESTEPVKQIETLPSIEEQMRMQTEQAEIEHNKLKELERQEEIPLDQKKGLEKMENEKSLMDIEPAYTPEPVHIPSESREITCGEGTVLVEGNCEMVKPEPKKRGFFEWLFSLFGM